jgi:DNA repair and recombination RAD54-like protein
LQTLLKQSPLPGKPTVDKGIIVCPSTLVKNWAKELGALLRLALRVLPPRPLTPPSDLLVKWLGEGVINPMVVDGKGGKTTLIPNVRRWVAAKGRQITQQGAPACGPTAFECSSANPAPAHPVMIVSYETLRTLQEELAGCEVGLLMADEGHRLKNADSLTFQALTAINCKRRVILTGTPVQVRMGRWSSRLTEPTSDASSTARRSERPVRVFCPARLCQP